MPFIQIIEFQTGRADDVEDLVEEWRAATQDQRTAQRGTLAEDRDRPGTFVQIVEFPSYEAAMTNSSLPATASFAERMGALCDGPAVFRNLDVRSVTDL